MLQFVADYFFVESSLLCDPRTADHTQNSTQFPGKRGGVSDLGPVPSCCRSGNVPLVLDNSELPLKADLVL